MKNLFFVAFIILTSHAIGQSSTSSGYSRLKTILYTNESELYKGFLTEISEDSLVVYDPINQEYIQMDLNSLERIAIKQSGSFGKGFLSSLLLTEPLIGMATAVEISFGSGFAALIFWGSQVVIAVPTGLLFGAINAQPKYYIDELDKTNIQALLHSRISQVLENQKNKPYQKSDLKQLTKFTFANEAKQQRLGMDYTPKVYFTLFSFGPASYSGQTKTVNYYKRFFDDVQSYEDVTGTFSIGVGYSPSPDWEFGYQFSFGLNSSVDTYNYSSDGWGTIYIETMGRIHRFSGLYRFKPYFNGIGSKWQISSGIGLSLLDSETIIDSYGFNNQSNFNYQSQTSIGFSLMTSFDYFIRKNISIQILPSYSKFSGITINSMKANNREIPAFTYSPGIFSLGFGLRFQI